jgi:hypothetical protein
MQVDTIEKMEYLAGALATLGTALLGIKIL